MKRIVLIIFMFLGANIKSNAQYCSSYGNTTYQTSVTRFVFNTIDNSSGKPSGYSDYTSISTQVSTGNTYNITVNLNTDGDYTVYARVWIDWNQDGDFDDSGEQYDMGSATNTSDGATSLSPLTITVPTSATSGTTRIRVSARYSQYPNSCDQDFDGEVEDYSLEILGAGTPEFHNTSSNGTPVFFDNIRSGITPVFAISSASAFNALFIEINTLPDFSGTSYTQTFNGSYSANTIYDFICDNLSPALPAPNGEVYYVRAKVSDDGGSTWGGWSTQTWSFTYDNSLYGWYQTENAQFVEGNYSGNFIYVTGNNNTADYIYMDRGSFDVRANTSGVKECGTWYPSSDVDYMTIGYQDDLCDETIYTGTRFPNVNIPQGASILSATYTLWESDQCPTTDPNNTIYTIIKAEDADNASALSSSIDAIPVTTNSATWSWYYTETANVEHSLSGIESIIQEVTDRAGWTEGNAITIRTEGYNTTDNGCVWQASHAPSTYIPRLQGTFTDFENTWMSPPIEFASLACSPGYQNLYWDADETYGSVKIQLYYDNGGNAEIIPDADLPGNSGGFTSSPVDISSLNTSVYSILYIKAILRYTSSNANETPKLNSWGISADPVASADAGNDQTICQSDTATLTVNGCGVFTWSTGATTATIEVSPSSTTTYYVTATAGDGDIAIDSVTINVATPVSISASATTICQGEQVTLTANGSTSYTWSASPSDNTLTGQENNQTINVFPGTTTTYTVTDNVCSTSDNVTITVNPLPSVDAGEDTTICEGLSITLTASGNGSFQWNTGATTQSITVSPSSTQNYSVTVTDGNGCSNSDTVMVSVLPSPTVSANAIPSTEICNGDTVILYGSGADSYTWDNGVQDSVPFTPSTTTTYTVIGTASNQCTDTATITITVNPLPDFDSLLIGDVTVCSPPYNGSITVYPAGMEYSYDNSPFVSSNTIDTFSVGMHYIIIRNPEGCTNDTSVTVNSNTGVTIDSVIVSDATCYGQQNGSITIYSDEGFLYSIDNGNNFQTNNNFGNLSAGTYNIIVQDSTGCEAATTANVSQPDAIDIQAIIKDVSCGNPGSISLSVTGGVPSYSYLWDTGDTTNGISGLSANTYNVTVTDNNNCTVDTAFTVPEGNLNGTLSVQVETPECYGDNTGSIIVSLENGMSPYDYSWSHDSNLSDSIAAGLYAGTYSVTVTDSIGCHADTTVQLAQPDSLYAETYVSDLNCYGDNSGQISITIHGGTQPYSVIWDNGSTEEQITGLSAGTYTATITDNNDCETTITAVVSQPDSLHSEVNITYSGNTGIADISTQGGTPDYTYIWSNGSNGNHVENLIPGTYTVTVSDANSCTEYVVVNIEQQIPVLIPTVITPNGDGANDTWKIRSIESVEKVEIQIYNRWGDIIFEFNGTGSEYTNTENQWDGTYNGKKLPFGTYLYVVKLNDEVYKGTVMIK